VLETAKTDGLDGNHVNCGGAERFHCHQTTASKRVPLGGKASPPKVTVPRSGFLVARFSHVVCMCFRCLAVLFGTLMCCVDAVIRCLRVWRRGRRCFGGFWYLMVGGNIVAPSLAMPLMCRFIVFMRSRQRVCVIVVGHRTLGHGFWLG
jgi:hypothetical protein